MDDLNPVQSAAELEKRWAVVQRCRSQIAAEVAKTSRELPGEAGRHLRIVGQWFAGSGSFKEALRRPDVFAVCLPLIKSTSEEFSPTEIKAAVRVGLGSLIRNATSGRRWIKTLIYPVLLICATAVLAFGFSFWIAPEFESMFAEFGIELPGLTQLVLAMARFTRQWGWIIALMLAGPALLGWILSWLNRNRHPFGMSWLDRQLMSTRNTVASWIWHISLLLEAGLSSTEAVRTAGEGSGESWLRRKSRDWTDSLETESNDQPFFTSRKLQMANYAIHLPRSEGQVALLREIASYYWDRNRSIGDWWINWLVAFTILSVGAAIGLAVIALFLPLLAIVSGLTGGIF